VREEGREGGEGRGGGRKEEEEVKEEEGWHTWRRWVMIVR